MTVYLSSVLIIIIEVKSFLNWALIPLFFLLTLLTVSHCLSPHPGLSSFLLHSLSLTILPPFAIAPLCYSSPLSPLQHCSPHISFSPFPPPLSLLSSFLGLVILTCWLKKTQWQAPENSPIFLPPVRYTFWSICVSVCVCVCVRERWLTLEKAKLPPPLQPPHCLWALLKG